MRQWIKILVAIIRYYYHTFCSLSRYYCIDDINAFLLVVDDDDDDNDDFRDDE
jgi:hypothetical protein